jgi:hypothetical protein
MTDDYGSAFKALQDAVTTLPDSLLSGARTGPIQIHLGSETTFDDTGNSTLVFPSLEDVSAESEWERVNKLWERAFKKAPGHSESKHCAAIVTLGRYGLPVVLDFLGFFAPRLTDSERGLLVPKIQSLLSLIRTQ